jgi:uncharacterized OB-fold protein
MEKNRARRTAKVSNFSSAAPYTLAIFQIIKEERVTAHKPEKGFILLPDMGDMGQRMEPVWVSISFNTL